MITAGHGPRLGQVEIRGDMQPGLALENDFFDAVALALQGADDLRIQRRAFRQAAELVEQVGAPLGLPGADPRLGLDHFLERRGAPVGLPVEFALQPEFQLFGGGRAIGADLEHAEIFSGEDGGRGEDTREHDRGRGMFHGVKKRGRARPTGGAGRKPGAGGGKTWTPTLENPAQFPRRPRPWR